MQWDTPFLHHGRHDHGCLGYLGCHDTEYYLSQQGQSIILIARWSYVVCGPRV